MMKALQQTIQCKCGRVKVAIDSPSALRLVCYCKDCRGYYNTLNEIASSNHKEPAAVLDNWGGVDWTQLYPSELRILEGEQYLTTCLIRPKSRIRRVYSTCCYTPMFSIGEISCLLNTQLVDKENQPDVYYRIIGRDSLKGMEKKPSMSWSVPLSWFWVMTKRVKKDRMTPLPLDIQNPKVLENFKQG